MLLSARTERVDFLKVLAATRREVRILVETDEPLRKPRPRQAARLRAASARVQEKLIAELAESHRRRFRGRVAIRLGLTLPEQHAALGLRRVVKEYIDMLRGVVFADDAVVDHLEVHRTIADGDRVRAELRCLPLAVFCDDFDRAFRLWDEIGSSIPQRGWGASFDGHARYILSNEESALSLIDDLNEQEDEQLAEDPDAIVDLDVPSTMSEFEDWQVRASAREYLADSVARSRGIWLCDQGIDSRDRPGQTPVWRQEAHDLDMADVVVLPDAGPGCFSVPPPPKTSRPAGVPPWRWHVERELSRQLSRHRMYSARFGGPVAMDIAFRGGSADHADVDNLAHTIVAAFHEVLADASLVVGGYRAYRQEAELPCVRVRLMPHGRLLALTSAIEQGRTLVRTDSAARERAAS